MPIEYQIDHVRRRVIATGRGTLGSQDFFGYQRDVWSLPEVTGYDELVDMSAVEHIDQPSIARIMSLAQLSAAMDHGGTVSKFAIVAPGDLAFGMGRMYQTHREMEASSNKRVGVFRSLPEALAFLDAEE